MLQALNPEFRSWSLIGTTQLSEDAAIPERSLQQIVQPEIPERKKKP
jgi:hypothetical protein